MQFDQLRRREFVTLLGGAAAWPLAARAQQPDRVRHVGVLLVGDNPKLRAYLAAFRRGFELAGWLEGRNAQIDVRFATNPEQVHVHAQELVALQPDVILACTTPAAIALQRESRTIPITFDKPEIVRINCDLHSWMAGWVVVAAHPYYAITGADGQFAFDNLPPGQYNLQVWHERLGTTRASVTIGDQQAGRVTVEMKSP